jgi:hypothetical protein
VERLSPGIEHHEVLCHHSSNRNHGQRRVQHLYKNRNIKSGIHLYIQCLILSESKGEGSLLNLRKGEGVTLRKLYTAK